MAKHAIQIVQMVPERSFLKWRGRRMGLLAGIMANIASAVIRLWARIQATEGTDERGVDRTRTELAVDLVLDHRQIARAMRVVAIRTLVIVSGDIGVIPGDAATVNGGAGNRHFAQGSRRIAQRMAVEAQPAGRVIKDQSRVAVGIDVRRIGIVTEQAGRTRPSRAVQGHRIESGAAVAAGLVVGGDVCGGLPTDGGRSVMA